MNLSSAGFLHFEVSGTDCALAIAHVREVLPMASLVRTPQLPTFIAGLLNIGGKPIPVVRLDQLLGLATSHGFEAGIESNIATSHLIWLRETSEPLLLMVDRVHAVFTALETDLSALKPHLTFNGCVSAQMNRGDKRLYVLAIDQLLIAQERKALAEFALRDQKRSYGSGFGQESA